MFKHIVRTFSNISTTNYFSASKISFSKNNASLITRSIASFNNNCPLAKSTSQLLNAYKAFPQNSNILFQFDALKNQQIRNCHYKFPTELPMTKRPGYKYSKNPVAYSREDGLRESFKDIELRMKRLNCGLWIRPRSGRHHRLWCKNGARRYRLRQHVFVNRTQCRLLDQMVTKYWKTPKYYLDDPYEPYQERNNINFAKQKWGTYKK